MQENNHGLPAVTIDEIDAKAFETYVQLLYSGQGKFGVQAKFDLPAPLRRESRKKRAKALDSAIEAAAQVEYLALSEQYVLCEKFRDLETKEKVLRAVIEATQKTRVDHSNRWPDEECVRKIHAGTLASDPMRLFLADSYAIAGDAGWMKGSSAASLPPEFLFDVVGAMFKYREIPEEYFQLKNASYYCQKLHMQAAGEEE